MRPVFLSVLLLLASCVTGTKHPSLQKLYLEVDGKKRADLNKRN